MTRGLHRRNRKHRRGAATVEMAVVAPILVMMMLGMIEVGYAFMVRHTLDLAANRAVRVATLPGYTSSDVIENVDDTLVHTGLAGYEVSTNLDELEPTEREVWVEVKMPINRVMFTGSLFGGGSFNITARRTAQREMDPSVMTN